MRILSPVVAAAALFSQTVHASDLVIWAPVKVAPRSYQTTVGFRLPMAWEMSAGADLGLAGAPGGTIASGSELATLWGRAVDSRGGSAGKSQRELALRLDALQGSGTLSLGLSRSWIFSRSLDMQTARSFNVNYAATQAVPASLSASQAVTMIFAGTGTSISASGTVTDFSGGFSGTLGLNQPIAANLDLSASVDGVSTAMPTGNMRVDYRIKW